MERRRDRIIAEGDSTDGTDDATGSSEPWTRSRARSLCSLASPGYSGHRILDNHEASARFRVPDPRFSGALPVRRRPLPQPRTRPPALPPPPGARLLPGALRPAAAVHHEHHRQPLPVDRGLRPAGGGLPPAPERRPGLHRRDARQGGRPGRPRRRPRRRRAGAAPRPAEGLRPPRLPDQRLRQADRSDLPGLDPDRLRPVPRRPDAQRLLRLRDPGEDAPGRAAGVGVLERQLLRPGGVRVAADPLPAGGRHGRDRRRLRAPGRPAHHLRRPGHRHRGHRRRRRRDHREGSGTHGHRRLLRQQHPVPDPEPHPEQLRGRLRRGGLPHRLRRLLQGGLAVQHPLLGRTTTRSTAGSAGPTTSSSRSGTRRTTSSARRGP